MIQNDHQLEATKKHLSSFRDALEFIEQNWNKFHPIQYQMKIDSLRSFIEEFELEIQEYDRTKK